MKRKLSILSLIAFSMLVITCRVAQKSATTTDQSTAQQTSTVQADTIPAFTANPSPAQLTPEQSVRSFRVPKGYHMELVASDPMIKEPVAIAWDGNARMYVAEMSTYMQDVDGSHEHDPISRVMLLEDTNNDGKMDKSSVFIDKLVLPRMILCVDHELLVNETDTYDIYSYKDTNGDGVADAKKPVFQLGKKSPGNLEHQRSGLDWNLDNWIYVTVDPVRFRYKNGVLKVDSLHSGSNGQWGLTHDNYGRLFFSRAGGEIPASGFQINPAYGALEFPDQYSEEFNAVWPIIATPDIQGGLRRLRLPDSTLNHFTASNGQSIFRGDKLPADLVGDYLIGEPVARIIRRAKVINTNGKLTLENAYKQQEFIASTDMNFRPVNTYTGPDGCLYIVDMNRGIIQESQWTPKDSYLRPQIQRLGLDKNVQHGRIYRLVYDGMKPGPKPTLLDESASKLITYLDHPNGWWRDNAQKQLVILGDQSVVPVLKQIALGEQGSLSRKPSVLGRLHALWTLEGLDAIDKDLLFTIMKDEDPQLRRAAIWISERYIKQGDEQVLDKVSALKNDPSYDVRTQLVLSTHDSKSAKAKALNNEIVEQNSSNEMLAGARKSQLKNDAVKTYGLRLGRLDESDRKLVMAGASTFKTLCATCHGPDGKGLAVGGSSMVAPALFGSKRIVGEKDVLIKILLHGLHGPVDEKNYPDVMPSMAANDDEWIASVLSYIRYEFGYTGNFPPSPPSTTPRPANGGIPPEVLKRRNFKPFVQTDEVRKIRQETAGRTQAWTLADLEKAGQ
jgi:glucose/arabinose dehydrogenase/mono/diheme cytochrome c family protein